MIALFPQHYKYVSVILSEEDQAFERLDVGPHQLNFKKNVMNMFEDKKDSECALM